MKRYSIGLLTSAITLTLAVAFCRDSPSLYDRISSADLWLREYHPELYQGVNPLFFPDTIPDIGFYWGEWGNHEIISINRWYNINQMELVGAMAHELMHANLGGAWVNMFMMRNDHSIHENIYPKAGEIGVEYIIWEYNKRIRHRKNCK